ncbi:flavin reductase family protein [Methylobacterium oryzae]|uniref:flavin reductase family protein n=1 Tax=Methylobacterium oryzae TaxID=334852 RepID=UPI0014054781
MLRTSRPQEGCVVMIPSQSISADQFKSVMRRFAASVNVITSVDGTVMNGMTATAVCSVSADPPSLLVIVNRSNRSHPVISRSGTFAVNVLSSDQEDLAGHFAAKKSDPFAAIDYRIGQTGCPLICDADATLECAVEQETDFGTHTIFVGRIVTCEVSSKSPLLYHAGRFCRLEDTALQYA